jgi:hypothetical protein
MAELMQLRADELHTDFRVQRDVEPAQVKKLTRIWDDLCVGNLTASLRDGHFWLIDGQQRVETKMQAGEPGYVFDVMVHEGLTILDEGRMFLAMNRDHKAVNSYDKYKVAVAVGEEPESTIDQIVRGLGLTVGKVSSQSVVGIPATLIRIYRAYGAGILTDSLILNERLSYNYGASPWDAQFIEGMAIFLNRHSDDPAFRMDRLVTALRNNRKSQRVDDLVQLGRARAINSNRAVGAVADVILEMYNSGLRRGRLEWKRASEVEVA